MEGMLFDPLWGMVQRCWNADVMQRPPMTEVRCCLDDLLTPVSEPSLPPTPPLSASASPTPPASPCPSPPPALQPATFSNLKSLQTVDRSSAPPALPAPVHIHSHALQRLPQGEALPPPPEREAPPHWRGTLVTPKRTPAAPEHIHSLLSDRGSAPPPAASPAEDAAAPPIRVDSVSPSDPPPEEGPTRTRSLSRSLTSKQSHASPHAACATGSSSTVALVSRDCSRATEHEHASPEHEPRPATPTARQPSPAQLADREGAPQDADPSISLPEGGLSPAPERPPAFDGRPVRSATTLGATHAASLTESAPARESDRTPEDGHRHPSSPERNPAHASPASFSREPPLSIVDVSDQTLAHPSAPPPERVLAPAPPAADSSSSSPAGARELPSAYASPPAPARTNVVTRHDPAPPPTPPPERKLAPATAPLALLSPVLEAPLELEKGIDIMKPEEKEKSRCCVIC